MAELALGKKTTALYEDSKALHAQLDRYAYGPRPTNQARYPSTNGPSGPGFRREPDTIQTSRRSRSPDLDGQVGR